MTLAQRLSRFLKADLHGLLDSLETPEEIVQQTIRDMEEALAHKEQHLATLRTTLHRLRVEQQELERVSQEIEHHIDLCFEAQNDTLARNFLRKRLETAQHMRQLARSMDDVQAQCTAGEQTLATQREQLATVVQQYRLYSTTQPAAAGTTTHSAGLSEDAVELAFLEEQRRRARPPQAQGA